MAEMIFLRRGSGLDEEGKKKMRYRFALVALVVVVGLGALFVFSYYINNRCFENYQVENEVERSDSNNVHYTYFNKNILKYSRSGISAMDNMGKSLWNGGYEMEQPQVDTCGNFVVAADVKGKRFYVYSGKDEGTSLETTLPIVRAKVSGQGVAAVLLEDSDSNVLNLYDPYGTTEKLLVEIPTNVSEEGYPLDFDISPDGQSVVASYLVVSGNTVENKVSFYNFTEVGQDKNTLVGGKSFGDSMISSVEFIGEDTVAVFHEKGFSLFGRMKQPEILYEKTFDGEIRSIACNEEYIAVVTASGEDREEQNLYVYNLRGREELSQEISYEYSDMEIYKGEIIFHSSHNCNILRINGHDKFDCHFDSEIEAVYPTENGSIYTMIDASFIRKIKLSGR